MGGGQRGGGAPTIIYQMPAAEPAPAPAEENSAVKEAERRQRVIESGLGGRSSTLLAGGAQTDVARRGSKLLGGAGTLG